MDQVQAVGATNVGLAPVEARVVAAVRAVLPSSARVVATRVRNALRLTINNVRLRARWAGDGWLHQVRAVLNRTGDSVDIVVARRLSPAAREMLSNASTAWLDETGAAEITLPSLVVSRAGDIARLGAREARWTPSTLAVAETLLCANVPATVSAIHAATGLSAGSCTTALASLTDMGLLIASALRGRRSARSVVDHRRLLDAYAEAISEMKAGPELRVATSEVGVLTSVLAAGRAWDRAGISWSLSGAAAAGVLAPSGRALISARVYVRANTLAEVARAAHLAGLRPAEDGAMALTAQPSVSATRLAQDRDGLRIAPWARIYADLLGGADVDESEAERLLESLGVTAEWPWPRKGRGKGSCRPT